MRALLKLNLGCGRDKRKGYVNVDVDPRLQPDVVHDLLKPLPFDDGSAKEILLQDVLEHVTKEQAEELLSECARVLIEGGRLLIRVPNVSQIVNKYKAQSDLLMLFLYGDTTMSGTWGAHKYGYTPELLEEMVAPFDLKLIDWKVEDTNYVFHLKKEKLANPNLTIRGNGWKPDFQKIDLRRFKGKSVLVCTDLNSYFLASFNNNKKIIWCVSRTYHPLISKTILRVLARNVDLIFCKDIDCVQFVREVLKVSHLKLVVAA